MGVIITDGAPTKEHINEIERELIKARKGIEDILKLIHLPGWTTPREFALIKSITAVFVSHAETLLAVSEDLVRKR